MDIAAMSIVMANTQVRRDASLAVMKQQGGQITGMLESASVPHPTLGNKIDVKG